MCIGNFDGLHRGHQALLRKTLELAGSDLDAAIITFSPTPRQHFARGPIPAQLQRPSDKLQMLDQLGMDLVWLMRFNARLAALTPEEFVGQVLLSELNARHVIVGQDFRFGKQRAGDVSVLKRLGEKQEFQVHAVEPVRQGGEVISSSRIRRALADGLIAQANELLGYPFYLSGRVKRGQQLGRTLGFPTLNMALGNRPAPIHGVFAVKVQIADDGEWLPGVASLGERPTLGAGETLLEVHLFDFAKELYGQRIRVRPIEKIRDELEFESLDELVKNMDDDARKARKLLRA